MKVAKADIAAAEENIAATKARQRAAVEAREAAQAAERAADVDVRVAESVREDLLAMLALERLPADLSSALASGVLTSEQWSSLVRRDLAGKTKDRWSRNPYWLTQMGQKVRRLIQEREKP